MAIRVRHYNRNERSRKRNRVHPDAELDKNLQERETGPSTMSDRALLRAIPATNGTQVRYAEPWRSSMKGKRRNGDVYDNEGNKLNTRKGRTTSRTKAQGKANRDIALMATMSSDHDYTTK